MYAKLRARCISVCFERISDLEGKDCILLPNSFV